ncbi:MAG: elongation factor P, partial [Candidatus Omnitrophica bacterium]|nr:elongation factor P [Candidatus Omnitrophota bacterium]
RSAERLDDIELEERRLQNLYKSGETFHFMCHETYEEIAVPADIIGENARFLQDNLEVTGLFYNDQILKVDLPTFIIAEVKRSETGLKGDSTKAGTKPAEIDTGTTVQVPLFIEAGDFIKIDTRSGTYVERVKK